MDILRLIQKRQTILNKDRTECKAINKQIQRKCRQKKETGINEDCEELE